jgi:hypothetical protein
MQIRASGAVTDKIDRMWKDLGLPESGKKIRR